MVKLRLLCVVLAAASVHLSDGLDLTCEIKKGRSAPNYKLSPEAKNSILYKKSQSASSFQALECTCGTEDVSLQISFLTFSIC